MLLYNIMLKLEIVAFNQVKSGEPFNNCNSKSNGEYDFFTRIRKHINI